MPLQGFNVSVEEAILEYITPSELSFKHKSLNYNYEFVDKEFKGKKSFLWRAENLKAVSFEPLMPHYLDFFPVVLLSPDEFEYEGALGDFSDWRSYGKWVYSLIKDRDELPEATIRKIHSLAYTISETKNKVEAVYKYMQTKPIMLSFVFLKKRIQYGLNARINKCLSLILVQVIQIVVLY